MVELAIASGSRRCARATPCSERSSASSETAPRAAGDGSSIRSTAPRATSAGCRSGRRCSRSRSTVSSSSAWSRPRRWAPVVGVSRAVAPSSTMASDAASRASPALGERAARCGAGSEDWDESWATRVGCSRSGGAAGARAAFGDFWGYMLVAEGAAEIALDAERVAVGPRGAAGDRRGGGRTVHRPRRARPPRTAAAGWRRNGLLHDEALAIVGTVSSPPRARLG